MSALSHPSVVGQSGSVVAVGRAGTPHKEIAETFLATGAHLVVLVDEEGRVTRVVTRHAFATAQQR